MLLTPAPARPMHSSSGQNVRGVQIRRADEQGLRVLRYPASRRSRAFQASKCRSGEMAFMVLYLIHWCAHLKILHDNRPAPPRPPWAWRCRCEARMPPVSLWPLTFSRPLGRRALDELRVQLLGAGAEGDVHAASGCPARRGACRASLSSSTSYSEAAALAPELVHGRDAALRPRPTQAPGPACICTSRAGCSAWSPCSIMLLIAHDLRRVGAFVARRRTRSTMTTVRPAGADVLLRAGVDERRRTHTSTGSGHYLRGHVAHQRHAACLGHIIARRCRRSCCWRSSGNRTPPARIFSSSWRGMRVKFSSVPSQATETRPYFCGLFRRYAGKVARYGIGSPGFAYEVHRYRRQTAPVAPPCRNSTSCVSGTPSRRLQAPRVASRCISLNMAAAVAHLHDRHAAAVPVEQLGLRLFENGLRQLRRAGREIVNSVRHLRTLP